MSLWLLNENLITYHLEAGLEMPSGTSLREHLTAVVEMHNRWPMSIEWHRRDKYDFSSMERSLVQLALMASLHPVDSGTLREWIHEMPDERRQKTRIFLLQALTYARPFHKGVWLALKDHLRGYIPDEVAQHIFPVWYRWGVRHVPDDLFPALSRPDLRRSLQVWNWHRHNMAEFRVVAEQPRNHPECLRYMQTFLRAPDWRIREQAARTLLELGWQPTSHSHQAQVAVALRNEKAIEHLSRKLQHAVSVIWFPRPRSLYTPAEFDLLNQPDMGFYLAVMEKISQKSWRQIELLARYSTTYGQRARDLLKQKPQSG